MRNARTPSEYPAQERQPPLFDPHGVFWRVNRETVLLLGGGSALLSQIAHPLVAAGVHEHSGFREQPVRRLYGTITAMQRMIYGPAPMALATAARIRGIHTRINGRLPFATTSFPLGTRYDACDPQLLLWVHSTLVATAIETYESFFPALTVDERERYYEESTLIGRLLGLTRDDLPSGWNEFRRYYRSMLDGAELEVTPVTRELARHILNPPVSWVPHVGADLLSVATTALLPAALRERYALPWSGRRERAWVLGRRLIRRVVPYLPGPVRSGPRIWYTERKLRRRPGPPSSAAPRPFPGPD